MSDECKMCNGTMITDEGCDPTDICHDCAHSRVEFLEQRVAELEAKNAELSGWKESMISVESAWNEQDVARALNMPLGASIRPLILPGINALKAKVERLS